MSRVTTVVRTIGRDRPVLLLEHFSVREYYRHWRHHEGCQRHELAYRFAEPKRRKPRTGARPPRRLNGA